MTLHDVTLDDKFDLARERIFVSGTQAVVRMLMMQRERDRMAGLNTAGFVSGYRGSPLGGLDQQFLRAGRHLAEHQITFQPGLNEELAATACWGTQQAELDGHGKYDGVFALWYGKGPGVDRSGDVFRHGNLDGSSKHGGVLVLMGDDHTAESSTNAHQTEFNFVDFMVPILNPAGVQELIDYGLYGYALSRFAGTWAALKCVKDNIESTASVDAGLDRLKIVLPEFEMPPGGLNIRLNDLDFLGQETRLHEYKRAAACAFIRANGLNRMIFSGGSKSEARHRDGRQELSRRAPGARRSRHRRGARRRARHPPAQGRRPWPFDYDDIRPFSDGLDMIIVVEEKRSLIEVQIREALYGTANQPVVVGKKDERGDWLFHIAGALDPNEIAVAVGERIQRVIGPSEEIDARVKRIRQFEAMLADQTDVATRRPYFCSGCPHNTSTRVPEGSIAGAGIGCHFMALWMDRDTVGFTQMGGEGAQWVGQAPFSDRPHFFQNLGDGTYNHSGILALRFAARREDQDHLQDPLQRRRRHDRRAAPRRQPHGRRHRPAGARGRRLADRRRFGRAAQVPEGDGVAEGHDLPPPLRSRRGAAGTRRHRRRERAPLRPDLRGREAPPAQARHLSGPGQAGADQRTRLRGLRRLRGQVELRVGAAGRDRVRPQAAHRPVELQQGLLLPRRLLPVLRHRSRREDEVGRLRRRRGARRQGSARGPAGGAGRAARRRLGLDHHRRRRHRRRHHRRHSRHGGASGGQGLRHDRHGGPGPEGRRGLQPCPHRAAARPTSTRSACRPARRISSSAATSSSPARARCSVRCARARRCSSPTRPR